MRIKEKHTVAKAKSGRKLSKRKHPLIYNDAEIINRIIIIRGQKVMLDRDLAEMYGVPTSRLNEAVRRNKERFPEDFMFQLTEKESLMISRSQIAILKKGSGSNIKYRPYAFTEQGVAMLSSVLRSERAVQVNIQIIRVYIRMKQLLLDNKELWQKIEKIEQALVQKDEEIKAIFNTLKQLLIQETKPRPKIGFTLSRQE
jgi:hypothetical protein